MDITRATHCVLREVLDKIDSLVSDVTFETGGILGSHDGFTIDEVIMDMHDPAHSRRCSYYPNVDFLNQQIKIWQNNGITFMGIFHTHFGGAKKLSPGDIKYITAIMEAMPSEVESLYFPVYVLPEHKMVYYKAKRACKTIEIHYEDIIIE